MKTTKEKLDVDSAGTIKVLTFRIVETDLKTAHAESWSPRFIFFLRMTLDTDMHTFLAGESNFPAEKKETKARHSIGNRRKRDTSH